MVGYIYLITDTTNGMKYTGKHHYNKEGELDPNYHGSGVIIKNIYKKRPETLKEEYIKTCYSEEEMCSDEQYYIKLFKTLYPNGYNLTEGGDGWSGGPCEETRRKLSEIHKNISDETRRKMSLAGKGRTPYNKGKHLSEEQKRKIGEGNKGKTMSEEARRKISEAIGGKKHPFFGKHHSEESKKKMSLAKKGKPSHNKGKKMSEEQKKKMSKKVLQFTLDGEFVREWSSMAECSQNGFIRSSVCLCCQGKQKSHKGFIFKYKEE